MTRILKNWPVILGGLCVLVGLISLRAVVLPVAQAMPNMAHYASTLPLALWGHILLGPLALLLVPVQLSTRLRAARPRLHRWLGRTYALCVLGGGLSAVALATRIEASAFAAIGFACLGLVWVGCTAMGVQAALTRRFDAHRRWMLRSAALAFAAVTLRIMMPVLIAGGGMTIAESYQVTAWGCWVPNLIVIELWLRRGAVRAARLVGA